MTDLGYVIKNEKGYYFAGKNRFDPRLRKAKIYNSPLYAEQICLCTKFSDMTLYIQQIKLEEIL